MRKRLAPLPLERRVEDISSILSISQRMSIWKSG